MLTMPHLAASHRPGHTYLPAAHTVTPARVTRRPGSAHAQATQPDGEAPSTSTKAGQEKEVGLGLKAVWYAAETFGKLIASGKDAAGAQQAAAPAGGMTREQILASIRDDYAANYFVSGGGAMAAYAPDCTFSDPFVSFKGTARFKQNVSNLGGLMEDIRIDLSDWEEGPDRLRTSWRFSCILALPWRPRLAASGSTTHVLDLARGCVVLHDEQWNVEPSKVVAQLFVPAAKVPGNAWETLFMAVADGDGKGVWFSLSPMLLRVAVPIIGVSLVCKLVTGEGLPGVALGTIEGLAYLSFVAGVATEVIKFAQGMQGGETGTGGRF